MPESKSSAFLEDVLAFVVARAHGRQFATLGGAWVQLGEELVALRAEIDKPPGVQSVALARQHLVSIAGTAWKAALDLGLESRGDAVLKDIPF